MKRIQSKSSREEELSDDEVFRLIGLGVVADAFDVGNMILDELREEGLPMGNFIRKSPMHASPSGLGRERGYDIESEERRGHEETSR